LALDPDARRRWRERRIGDVPLGSARGIVALALLLVCIALALANPIVATMDWLQGNPSEAQEVTLEVLIINFAFNAVILVLLPVAGLAIARPDRPGAVVRRLGLEFTPKTILWMVIGVGAAIGSIFALGGIIWGLTEVGFEAPEESPLIDDIDALLTWPLVFLIPLVASLTEEIFFRGVLQPRVGLIASSLFFGIVHIGYGTWLQVVAPAVLGLVFGYLFQRSRSLWTAIAAHYAFDFIELVALKLTE
jgi:membrane protease YdiL (CAAX protease family)